MHFIKTCKCVLLGPGKTIWYEPTRRKYLKVSENKVRMSRKLIIFRFSLKFMIITTLLTRTSSKFNKGLFREVLVCLISIEQTT